MRRFFCLVSGVNTLVCVGPTAGNNAKVLYWAWYWSLSSPPFRSQQPLSFKWGLRPNVHHLPIQWWKSEVFLTTLITALQHFLKRQDLAFGLNKTPKCHKRGENWEDYVYYTGTFLVRNELNPTLHSHGNKSLSHYRPELDLNYQATH